MAQGEDGKGTARTTSVEEYELLLDAIQDYALIMLATDGTIRTWNAGAERIFGYDAAEATGRNFSIFYAPEDGGPRKPKREIEIAARDGRLEDEGWRQRKDGKRFWASTVIAALYEDDGTLHGFAKVTRDLTERRTAEEKLRRSEEMFSLLVTSVKDYAIFMLDPSGFVLSWNEGAQRIKGYRPEEVIGQHFSVFYPEKDREAGRPSSLLGIATREGQVEDEGWRVRKDGSRFWANVLITAVRSPEGDLLGFAKVTRDITEQRKAEELRQALLEQREAHRRVDEERRLAEASSRAAQEANRSKDEFLMMLSHELRTPLTSILGWARLLPTIDHSDEAMVEGLEAIARSAKVQAQLIDDVLDVSRIVAGKLKLNRRSVDLAATASDAVDQIRSDAEAKGVSIEEFLSEDLGTGVVDPIRLQQILWNLLSNAVKFSAAGDTVTLTAERSGADVSFSVRDEGKGIPRELQSEIFEAFRQADMSVNREHGGLGLGLTIVRHLTEAHSGVVKVESEGIDRGATFHVTIPVGGSGEAAIQPETHEHPHILEGRLEGRHVILVDDDSETLRLLISVMERAGAEVTGTASVPDALIACARRRPDLIVTDIGMPGQGGRELLKRLEEAGVLDDTPVVAISAFDFTDEDIARFDRVVRKPIDPFDLIDRLEEALEE